MHCFSSRQSRFVGRDLRDCTARVEKMHQKSSDLVLPGPPFAGRLLAELDAIILKAGLFRSPKSLRRYFCTETSE